MKNVLKSFLKQSNNEIPKKEIAELVRRMKESPEVCPDEEDADKAIQDALDNFFVNDLLKQKPIGDA